jgi:hypothetical protein
MDGGAFDAGLPCLLVGVIVLNIGLDKHSIHQILVIPNYIILKIKCWQILVVDPRNKITIFS